LENRDIESLKDLWFNTQSTNTRNQIVQEFEKRKASDALNFCLYMSHTKPISGESIVTSIEAIGRVKDPESIKFLRRTALTNQNKNVRLAVLRAYKEMNNREALYATKDLLKTNDKEILLEALETLSHFDDSVSMDAISPFLFVKDPDIRWKAISALGNIGNPETIGIISLLLADVDPVVNGLAENVLKKLGASEEQIQDWKAKSKELSLEDLYSSKLSYQKAMIEKRVLERKLENKERIKTQLEITLKKRNISLKKQQALVESLYEREKKLKIKVFELQQAQDKIQEYKNRLKNLNHQIEKMNKELMKSKSEASTAIARKELDKILKEKSSLENEAKSIKAKEVNLQDEVLYLKSIAQETRYEAEKAKKELKIVRDRETQIMRQMEEIKIAYRKAIKEKEVLEKKLESESDVKIQLESALKKRELSLKKQQTLIQSLYENERQQKSKLDQLDITKKQSKDYEKKLNRLSSQINALQKELIEAKSENLLSRVEKKMAIVLEEKSTMEKNAANLKEKEEKLHAEVSALKTLAEKKHDEAENAKRELEALRNRESQLANQLEDLKKRLNRGMTPILVVSKPKSGTKFEIPTTVLHLVAVDDRGIYSIQATLNGKPITLENTRGTRKALPASPKAVKKLDLSARLKLEYGENIISVSVKDTDGASTKESIKVTRVKSRGKIWAAIIGINQYPHTRNLKYAVNDALEFKNYLEDYIGIPKENIFYLTDQNATKYKIESLLGTKLKRKASKDDTVFIFYAGHGAVEADPVDPDGDGFEKYLLPYDARLDDLYTTAISMNDVRIIFQRNRAQRLVFIADTCYSGASGGRSMLTSKTRATLSDQFFERVSKGKGRVIISACSANEVSKEDDRLKHGIFSYYLLEGLKGKSDINGDNIITVSELFSYLSRKVPEASGQDQHPVKKGETEGELVIGYVK